MSLSSSFSSLHLDTTFDPSLQTASEDTQINVKQQQKVIDSLYKENYELKLQLYHLQDQEVKSPLHNQSIKDNPQFIALQHELEQNKKSLWDMIQVAKNLRNKIAGNETEGEKIGELKISDLDDAIKKYSAMDEHSFFLNNESSNFQPQAQQREMDIIFQDTTFLELIKKYFVTLEKSDSTQMTLSRFLIDSNYSPRENLNIICNLFTFISEIYMKCKESCQELNNQVTQLKEENKKLKQRNHENKDTEDLGDKDESLSDVIRSSEVAFLEQEIEKSLQEASEWKVKFQSEHQKCDSIVEMLKNITNEKDKLTVLFEKSEQLLQISTSENEELQHQIEKTTKEYKERLTHEQKMQKETSLQLSDLLIKHQELVKDLEVVKLNYNQSLLQIEKGERLNKEYLQLKKDYKTMEDELNSKMAELTSVRKELKQTSEGYQFFHDIVVSWEEYFRKQGMITDTTLSGLEHIQTRIKDISRHLGYFLPNSDKFLNRESVLNSFKFLLEKVSFMFSHQNSLQQSHDAISDWIKTSYRTEASYRTAINCVSKERDEFNFIRNPIPEDNFLLSDEAVGPLLSKATEEISRRDSTIQEMEHSLAFSQKKLDEFSLLEKQLHQITSKYEVAKMRLEDQSKEIANLEERLHKMGQELQSKNNELDKANSLISEHQNLKNNHSIAIESLNKEKQLVKDLCKQLSDQEKSNVKDKQHLYELQELKGKLLEELTHLQVTCDNLSTEMSQLKEVESARTRRDSIIKKDEMSKETIDKEIYALRLKDVDNAWNLKFSELRNKYEGIVRNLQSELSLLKKSESELKARLEDLNNLKEIEKKINDSIMKESTIVREAVGSFEKAIQEKLLEISSSLSHLGSKEELVFFRNEIQKELCNVQQILSKFDKESEKLNLAVMKIESQLAISFRKELEEQTIRIHKDNPNIVQMEKFREEIKEYVQKWKLTLQDEKTKEHANFQNMLNVLLQSIISSIEKSELNNKAHDDSSFNRLRDSLETVISKCSKLEEQLSGLAVSEKAEYSEGQVLVEKCHLLETKVNECNKLLVYERMGAKQRVEELMGQNKLLKDQLKLFLRKNQENNSSPKSAPILQEYNTKEQSKFISGRESSNSMQRVLQLLEENNQMRKSLKSYKVLVRAMQARIALCEHHRHIGRPNWEEDLVEDLLDIISRKDEELKEEEMSQLESAVKPVFGTTPFPTPVTGETKEQELVVL